MRLKDMNRIVRLLILLVCLPLAGVLAASESYIQTLTGKLKKGDSLTVIDDKFLHLPVSEWNQLKHLSVDNIISFELRQDTSLNYYSKSFSCTLNITIKYFTSHDQETPEEINNIDLVVKYDTARGHSFPDIARYKFKNAFKVIVIINSIQSPEWKDKLPAVFRLKNQILVERKYPYSSSVAGVYNYGKPHSRQAGPFVGLDLPADDPKLKIYPLTVTNGQLKVSWDVTGLGTWEEYDVEWMYVDALSDKGYAIKNSYGGEQGPFTIPDNVVGQWMLHDNTRVTVGSSPYVINLHYTEGYILVRVRGAYYDANTNVRILSEWQYQDVNNKAVCINIAAHQPNITWQYTGAFAEEGKNKEVITYFDGTQRNRQSVTISNGDHFIQNSESLSPAIVQETIYDVMGRPAVNVLPAPVKSNSLGYYPSFNLNAAGAPFSFSDINLEKSQPGGTCVIGADNMSTASGASQYYSPNNSFLDGDNAFFTKYVADAEKYPYSLTEYTRDNTGRIRRQGGVGPGLQIGTGKETKYYYGKPTQRELERLFGMEVGDVSHYLKNMVVDPNGQVSVSYVDANGKTIATALAGSPADNLDILSSAREVGQTPLNEILIKPADFSADGSGLSMKAVSTFLAAMTGDFKLYYSVSPLALVTQYGPGGANQLCNNCYYTVIVTVTNECGDIVATTNSIPFTGNDATCYLNPLVVTQELPFRAASIGEYNITYSLQLSDDVIKYQTDYYVQHNTDLQQLQDFFLRELNSLDLQGCYNSCNTCKTLGSTVDDFREHVMTLLGSETFNGVQANSAAITNWITTTWTTLKAKCSQISCLPASPCEEKLEQLKRDVMPGGQYATYDADALAANSSTVFTEVAANVMAQYNINSIIANTSFVAEDGSTKTIGSLSQADFVRAYLIHSEWADLFVKLHIEYCSYQWCKDQSNPNPSKNNEVSYIFDENLRQNYTNGSDAVSAGYYNRQDPYALLRVDPFFGNQYGSAYYTSMQSDLQQLSKVLSIAPTSNSSDPISVLPAKNILQLIDWMLYCKMTDPNASSAQVQASWNSCSPADNCRSVTMEWQLYRNYYLQLKSKYYRIAKQANNPNCRDCFIGADPLAGLSLTGCVDNSKNPPVVPPCPAVSEFSFEYEAITPNTISNPTFFFQGRPNVESNVYYKHAGGAVSRDVIITVTKRINHSFTGYLDGDQYSGGPDDYGEDVPVTKTISAGQDRVLVGQSGRRFQVTKGWPEQGKIYNFTFDEAETFFLAIPSGVSCPAIIVPPVLPSSFCSSDPKYQQYQNKTRVFNDYVDIQSYATCNAANLNASTKAQKEAESRAAALADARENLMSLKAIWLDRLKTVRDEEAVFAPLAGSSLSNAVLENLTDRLYDIADVYLQIAAQQQSTLQAVSTLPNPLPSGFSAPNGYYSFNDAFTAIIGTSLMSKGFGPDLLNDPYPYDKMPYVASPNVYNLNANICSNVAALRSAWVSAGSPGTFHSFLQQQLGDDYLLSAAELNDVETRCASGCPDPYLSNPLLLPVAFVVAHPNIPGNAPIRSYATCSVISGLATDFQSAYPEVLPDTKLYRTLYTNYLNHRLGYPLSYGDYADFTGVQCVANSSALLYDKPKSPSVKYDDFSCTADLLKGAYFRAGQGYEIYINGIRVAFRNAYISKCLSNQAAARITGTQYEYHYTLYYYDQSGNLAKTVPPEGVRLLSETQIDLLEQLPAIQDPSSCPAYPTGVSIDKQTILNSLSTGLQNNSAQSMEMWLDDNTGSATRQLRMVTPDKKYMYQVAIADNKLWLELYSMQPGLGGSGSIDITLTNQAVADLPARMPLQPWSHLVAQSSGGLAGGDMQLYLDGFKLNLIPSYSIPIYPYQWEIGGVDNIPAENMAIVKHLRLYNRTITDAEIIANYRNSCLSPVGSLAGAPLQTWGRFDVPTFCNSNIGMSTPITASNKGSLTIASNPDPGSNYGDRAFNSITNSFTVEFWVNPQVAQPIYPGESTDLVAGTKWHPYVIFPSRGGAPAVGDAGMGISVGTNGVTVFEHADSYLPAVLNWSGLISGWTHIAVVYNNRTPILYVNGIYEATGRTPTKATIYPSYNIGGGAYGYMTGGLDELRIWSTARTAEQIFDYYSKTLSSSDQAGLVGYWPMDARGAGSIKDISCNNYSVTLNAAAENWTNNGAPLMEADYVEYAARYIVPNHGLPSVYAYNSLNQVVKQSSPDGGVSNFTYDVLGRLAISQNAEQSQPTVVDAGNPANRFSYTRYDGLGRITEVGEKLGATALSELDARDNNKLFTWLNSGSNRQVTVTEYDLAPGWAPAGLTQSNLRKRVSGTALLADGSNRAQRLSASYYSYDYAGNVKELVLENTGLVSNEKSLVTNSDGLKRIRYEYDLISGKVNKVLFQDGKWDQFYYMYRYDAENRLVQSYSSRFNSPDITAWTNDATYRYYLHGPLARMELGRQKVQGVDYTYTLQGWLKGVNGQQLMGQSGTQTDMAGDGVSGTTFSGFGRDVMAYSLNYYKNDYKSIGGVNAPAFSAVYDGPLMGLGITGKALYNGNISGATYAIAPFDAPVAGQGQPGGFAGYTYRYDQLNRLTAMDRRTINSYTTAPSKWSENTILLDYKEEVSYDGNGNIKTYLRNGTTAGNRNLAMDDLSYHYNRDVEGNLLNNKLRDIDDKVAPDKYPTVAGDPQDIDAQQAENYTYDAIGNLIKDKSEHLDKVDWTVYGKIKSIKKSDNSGLGYVYDASGNRISKVYTAADGVKTTTHYVRDPQGNVLAVYQYKASTSGALTQGEWQEQHLYGSSRLGMVTPHVVIPAGQPLVNANYNGGNDAVDNLGNRLYELSNHLGNVLATISDRHFPVNPSDPTTTSFLADVVSAQDYYPFGMQMPGRTYIASSSLSYRYGFNGKENDNEVKGVGEQQDYGMRIYDPRAGRFLSTDPVGKHFPWNSPYAFAENRVVEGIDFDGLEVVLLNKEEDPIIYKVGMRDKNTESINVYAHGNPRLMEDNTKKADHPPIIATPEAFDKIMKEKSEQWRNRKKAGNTVVILHSCRTGKTTVTNGKTNPSLAEKFSKTFKDVVFIAPDERDVFTDGIFFGASEKGPRKAIYQDANGERLPGPDGKITHETTNEKGHWQVFKNGKLIATYDGNWDPHDYKYEESKKEEIFSQSPKPKQAIIKKKK